MPSLKYDEIGDFLLKSVMKSGYYMLIFVEIDYLLIGVFGSYWFSNKANKELNFV